MGRSRRLILGTPTNCRFLNAVGEPDAQEAHSSFVHGVAVAPDVNFAVSASRDGTLKVWNLESGAAFRTLEEHTDNNILDESRLQREDGGVM